MKRCRETANRHVAGGERGFSIIEFTISFAILAVVFVSLGAMASLSYSAIDDSSGVSVATFKLETAHQLLRSTPFSMLLSRYPPGSSLDFDSIDDDDANNLRLPSESITISYADISADPLEITVTIDFRDAKGFERSLSLSTLRTK